MIRNIHNEITTVLMHKIVILKFTTHILQLMQRKRD